MTQHPDECPDSTILHDAALFLYEVHAHGWTELGQELRTRPAVAAFLARQGAVRAEDDRVELTLAGRSLSLEVVRRAQAMAKTDLGRRAEAGRALSALVAEHRASGGRS